LDADRIAQVISNLVGNAPQHGTPGTPVVVESRIVGDDAVLAVKNDGPTISHADLDQLFEPYRRGGTAAPRASGSVGLGLYIARQVVVAHGGTIDVQSLPGEGTCSCFTVRMPRFASRRASSAPSSSRRAASDTS
jgi:signal transduction histidine kinase